MKVLRMSDMEQVDLPLAPPEDDRIAIPVLDVVPLDVALTEIFARHEKTYLGGSSGTGGWSAIKSLQSCAYKYKLEHIAPPRKHAAVVAPRRPALEIGILYHLLRAMEDAASLGREEHVLDRDLLRDELLAANASGEVVMEAYRLDDHYRMQYENDYLAMLDVECAIADGVGGTARLDAIGQVGESDLIAPGTYIVERKTTSRFDAGSTEGWSNDGGIIGQQMIWKAAKLDRKFGKLQGTIVDLVSKTKVPAFRRIVVPVQRAQIKGHAADLAYWRAQRDMYEATGNWPRSRAACVSRFGLCEFFAHCAGG